MTLQNMTTPLRALLPAALMLLAATACEDTLDNPAAHTGNGPALTLVLDNNEDNAGTRTALTGSDATHHVKTVDILIFEGEGDNATYVGSQTVYWPQPENTVDKQPVNHMECTLTHTFNANTSYILLGVGKDGQFDNTYKIIDEGQTLGQTYAILKAEADKDNIAACEFFTGTVSFTYQKEVQIDDLLMKRRVAGVMLYVTEIPQELTQSDGTYRVTKVQLCLGPEKNQNKSVLLKREFDAENWTEPAQESLDDSNVLAEIDLSNLEYTQGADFYMDGEEAAKCYAGLYMLPLDATEDKPTFLIKLRGKKDDGSGTLGEEEELSKAFVVENHSEGSTSFPVRSNYIYCIGEKNEQEGIDEPVSLSGTAIYLKVNPWEATVDNNPDFGPARVMAVFDDTQNPIYNCMNDWHQINILLPLESIQERVVKIEVEVDETIMPVTEGNEDDMRFNRNWLYIEQYENPPITNRELDTYEPQKVLYNGENANLKNYLAAGNNLPPIVIFMEDYARQRNWGWVNGQWDPQRKDIENINNDWRYAKLVLSTYLQGEEMPRTDEMIVKQYNTITVNYKTTEDGDTYEACCGFSRKDMWELNSQNEKEYINMRWGYHDTKNDVVYVASYTGDREVGAVNMTKIQTLTNINEEIWPGSAMKTAQHTFKRIEENGSMTYIDPTTDNDTRTNKCWYLPAQYEMQGLMEMSATDDKAIKERLTKFWSYWVSTTPGGSTRNTYYYTYPPVGSLSKNNPWACGITDRQITGETAYIRQARKFSEYDDYAEQGW